MESVATPALENWYLTVCLFGACFWGFLFVINPVLFIISIIQAIIKKSSGWIILSVVSGLFILIPLFLFLTGVYKTLGVYNAIFNRRTDISVNQELLQKQPESIMLISQDGSCLLTIPANWDHLEQIDKKESFRVGNLMLQQYLTVISDSESEGTFEEYAATAYDKLLSKLKGSDKGNIEELFIGDKKALRYQFTGSTKGVKMTYILTVIEGAKGYYQVLAWTSVSREGENLEVLKQAVSKFREI
jgi:hypothetical protein